MKTYLIDSKVKIRGETYTIRFYDFFHYFFDGQTRSLLTSSFFTDLFPLTGFLTLKRFKKAIESLPDVVEFGEKYKTKQKDEGAETSNFSESEKEAKSLVEKYNKMKKKGGK